MKRNGELSPNEASALLKRAAVLGAHVKATIYGVLIDAYPDRASRLFEVFRILFEIWIGNVLVTPNPEWFIAEPPFERIRHDIIRACRSAGFDVEAEEDFLTEIFAMENRTAYRALACAAEENHR